MKLTILIAFACWTFSVGHTKTLRRLKRSETNPCKEKFFLASDKSLCCPCSKCPIYNPSDVVVMSCFDQYKSGIVTEASEICLPYSREACVDVFVPNTTIPKTTKTTTTTTTTTTPLTTTTKPIVPNSKPSTPFKLDDSTEKTPSLPSVHPPLTYMLLGVGILAMLLLLVIAVGCICRYCSLHKLWKKCQGNASSDPQRPADIRLEQLPAASRTAEYVEAGVNTPEERKISRQDTFQANDPIVRQPSVDSSPIKALDKNSLKPWNDDSRSDHHRVATQPSPTAKATPFIPNHPATDRDCPAVPREIPPVIQQPPTISINTVGANATLTIITGSGNHVLQQTPSSSVQPEPSGPSTMPTQPNPSIHARSFTDTDLRTGATGIPSACTRGPSTESPPHESGSRPTYPMRNDHPSYSQKNSTETAVRGPPSRVYPANHSSSYRSQYSEHRAESFANHSDAMCRTFQPKSRQSLAAECDSTRPLLHRPPPYEEGHGENEDLYSSNY